MTNQALVPTTPLDRLHKEVDRLFGGFFDFSLPSLGFSNGHSLPKMDVRQTEKTYELDVELPGVPAKDVSVSVQNGVLTVRGEQSSEKEDKKDNYIRVERSYGSFERSVSLPEDADVGAINATSKDGVLHLTVQRKADAKPDVKTIPVKTA